MKRKTITLEIDELTVVRYRRNVTAHHCSQCGSVMLTLEEAAASLPSDAKVILGLLSDGKVHFIQLSGGVLLVCDQSLHESYQREIESITQRQSTLT